jgi:hypothetical protein
LSTNAGQPGKLSLLPYWKHTWLCSILNVALKDINIFTESGSNIARKNPIKDEPIILLIVKITG